MRGVRHVQAIIVSDSSDPELRELRAAVLRVGGSVHAFHPSMHAITVQVPAQRLNALAQRDDVVSITPNRTLQRTLSTLESVSAALTTRGRTYSSATSYTGIDGSGVGIAVLDSGVMKSHRAFDGTWGTRVKRNVTMLNTNLANWTTGVDSTTSLAPGSLSLNNYESAVSNDAAYTPDAYGHGTHVASVAAGRGFGFYAAPDNTGIAPGASIYDVKVLNDQGVASIDEAYSNVSASNPIVDGTYEDLIFAKANDRTTGGETNAPIKRNPNFGAVDGRYSPLSAQFGMALPKGMDLAVNAGFNSSNSTSIFDLDRTKVNNFLNVQTNVTRDSTLDARVTTNARSALRSLRRSTSESSSL